MAKAKNKYYVVWVGLNPGIYDSWTKCQLQIKGVSNPRYKGFPNKALAEKAYAEGWENYWGVEDTSKNTLSNAQLAERKVVLHSLSVDAACAGNPGKMEYRGVMTDTREEVFKMGPFADGTNNVGEFLALVHGLAQLKKIGSDLPIYSDSKIAISWIKQKTCKTKLAKTEKNVQLHALIKRGEEWLRNNQWNTPIYKWETKEWGEIPADFGRK